MVAIASICAWRLAINNVSTYDLDVSSLFWIGVVSVTTTFLVDISWFISNLPSTILRPIATSGSCPSPKVIWQKIQIVLVYYKNKWKDCAKDWAVLRYYECYGGTIDRTVHKNTHATRNSTLLESVDWSVVSRPRPSANYIIVAMVPKRWYIACKATNEQTNPSSHSSEYIMVSNALGGVNGRSRAVILRYIDQYRQASLPD